MPTQHHSQRGVALLLVMFTLMIVTAVGLSMMFQADTETAINSNFRDEQAAFYAAKAGLEEARDRMRTTAGTPSINASLPTALPGAVNGVLYVINPTGSETVAPWSTTNAYFDNEICREVDCSGGQVPPTSGWYMTAISASTAYAASPVLPYKWMRISLKTNRAAWGSASTMYVNGSSSSSTLNYYVCWNAAKEIVSSTPCAAPNKPVYSVVALAVSPTGSRRMVQYELTQDSLRLTFPAALTLDGTGDTFAGLNSNGYYVEGNDHAGCGGTATASTVPAVGVTNNTDLVTVYTGIPIGRQDHYTGLNAGPYGGAPDVENVSSTLPTNMQSVSALESMLANIRTNATQVLTGNQSSLTSPGTSTSPQIIFVDGDLSLSGNTTGYGVLVVTGRLTVGGNIGWKGIVLVVGQGVVIGSGGGSAEYDGAFLVAKTRDSAGSLLSSVGGATFDWSGGGGNGVYYTSGCINQAQWISDYRVLSTRELMR